MPSPAPQRTQLGPCARWPHRRWTIGGGLVGILLALAACQPAPPSAAGLGLAASDSARLAALLTHFEPPGRDRWQQPAVAVEALRLPRGAAVLEVGATTGYFAQALQAARPRPPLTLVEGDTLLLRFLRQRFRGRQQLSLIAAPLDSFALPPRSFARILVADGLGRMPPSAAAWRRLMPLLAPGGQLVLIACRPGTPVADSSARPAQHWLHTLQAAGFRSFELDSTLLPYHVLISAE